MFWHVVCSSCSQSNPTCRSSSHPLQAVSTTARSWMAGTLACCGTRSWQSGVRPPLPCAAAAAPATAAAVMARAVVGAARRSPRCTSTATSAGRSCGPRRLPSAPSFSRCGDSGLQQEGRLCCRFRWAADEIISALACPDCTGLWHEAGHPVGFQPCCFACPTLCAVASPAPHPSARWRWCWTPSCTLSATCCWRRCRL